MYEVLFRAEVTFGQEYKVLTRAQQREMLHTLEQSPRQQKPLRGDLQGCYRYRCGGTRVVFTVDDVALTVTVIAIGPRRDAEVYDLAARRR